VDRVGVLGDSDRSAQPLEFSVGRKRASAGSGFPFRSRTHNLTEARLRGFQWLGSRGHGARQPGPLGANTVVTSSKENTHGSPDLGGNWNKGCWDAGTGKGRGHTRPRGFESLKPTQSQLNRRFPVRRARILQPQRLALHVQTPHSPGSRDRPTQHPLGAMARGYFEVQLLAGPKGPVSLVRPGDSAASKNSGGDAGGG